MANLAKASPEPGLYKGTYPSVLRVPFGEGVKKAGAREAKEITSACVFIFLAAVAFIHTTPAATSSTSPTPNRGREESQGSRGRSHGASLRLRKRRRLTFYPVPILLQFCMHTHVHWCSPGRVIHPCRRRSVVRARDGDAEQMMKVRPATTPHRARPPADAGATTGDDTTQHRQARLPTNDDGAASTLRWPATTTPRYDSEPGYRRRHPGTTPSPAAGR